MSAPLRFRRRLAHASAAIVLLAVSHLSPSIGQALELEVEYLGSISDRVVAPTSIAGASDAIAVLEPFGGRLTRYTPDGVRTHDIALTGAAHGLQRLTANDYLYCNRTDHRIELVNLITGAQTNFASVAALIDPTDLVVSGDRIFALDNSARSIVELDQSGIERRSVPLPELQSEHIEYFSSLAFDSRADRFIVFEQISSTIWLVGTDGSLVAQLAGFGSTEGEITRGGALAFDERGLIYAVDRYQGRIAVYAADGLFYGYLDATDFAGARLVNPAGVAVDADGVLYVTSTESGVIHMAHIVKPVDPRQGYLAAPVYPPLDAVVQPNSLALTAEITVPAAELTVGVFEFQLYPSNDTTTPLQTGSAPGAIDTVTVGGRTLSANWTPTAQLSDEGRYQWRVRYVLGEVAGPWSQLQSFRTTTLPREFALYQNYPNPFNPATKIEYALPRDVETLLEVINILGQRVATIVRQPETAGVKSVVWDGRDDDGQPVASGVYFYRLKAAEFVATKKMLLVK